VEDALTGYAWDDDSQIVTAIIKKRFGSPPRIEIDIQLDTEE
jgi:Holliday junction resolvase RusA-like endonuclease